MDDGGKRGPLASLRRRSNLLLPADRVALSLGSKMVGTYPLCIQAFPENSLGFGGATKFLVAVLVEFWR